MREFDYLSLRQTCKLLQVHPQTIYTWRRNGDFPRPTRIGKRKLFWLKSDLLDWLDRKNQSEGFGDPFND